MSEVTPAGDSGTSVITGVPLNTGIAIGKVFILNNLSRIREPVQISKSEAANHKKIYEKARKQLASELEELATHLDGSTANIIDSQIHVVMDPEIENEVFKIIDEELTAVDYAIYTTYDKYIARIKQNGSELFRQRIVDLENVRNRLISLVSEGGKPAKKFKNTIVIASEVGPLRLIDMYKNGLKGLVLGNAGTTSHAAIIAKSLAIPCIVNAEISTVSMADYIVLDSNEGLLIRNPDKETLKKYKSKLSAELKRQKNLLKIASTPKATLSGTPFTLQANLEFLSEFDQLKAFNITDIGLLRTEWMLLGGQATEKEQLQYYSKVLKAVKGSVVIRLFDVGGDKLNELAENKEGNPFLGFRGIRLLLENEFLLRTQIRAILKTAVKFPGRVKLLIPMVSVEEEILRTREIIKETEAELAEEGIRLETDVSVGIMVEVPSIALIADKVAQKIDFFSIGTNDLTQYTLAVDRGNKKVSNLYKQIHPAVWQLIHRTVQAGKKNNVAVSVCGELAGDVLGACGLIGLGVTELSMAPASLPAIHEELTLHSDEDFQELARALLSAANSVEIMSYFEVWRTRKAPVD